MLSSGMGSGVGQGVGMGVGSGDVSCAGEEVEGAGLSALKSSGMKGNFPLRESTITIMGRRIDAITVKNLPLLSLRFLLYGGLLYISHTSCKSI